jgi:peroxiredoxin
MPHLFRALRAGAAGNLIALRVSVLCFFAASTAVFPPSLAGEPSKEVADFALLDFRGRYYHLKQTDAKAVVLFFTGNGCTVARQSIPKLRKLRERFQAEGVTFWMVNSVSGDDRESIEKEAWEFHTRGIPVLIDDTQGVAAMLGVSRTATVVLIETGGWTVLYQGAIDDQLVEGSQKPQPAEKFLENALTAFLAGKPLEKAKTAVRGCLISFDKQPVSYSRQVAPILAAKCYGCHSPGNIGPHKMTQYSKVRGISDMIQEVLLARRMPPWHADPRFGSFVNDSSLTLNEAKTLLRWIEQGAPRDE